MDREAESNDVSERDEYLSTLSDELRYEKIVKRMRAERTKEFVELQEMLNAEAIKYFDAAELLYLGGGHHVGNCAGQNDLPKKEIWGSIIPTVKVLDLLREKIGGPIYVNSAFRNKPYNTCIGGAKNSMHLRFNAIDFRTNAASPKDCRKCLLDLRISGDFTGGIGVYNTFVHVDTRGYNEDW